MGRKNDDEKVTVVEQGIYPVPDIPIKDLLDAIPFVRFQLIRVGFVS
jgi:omega-6 fatty acid desaturase (delta-12 desaturase)